MRRNDIARFINGQPNERLQKIINNQAIWKPKYAAKMQRVIKKPLYQE